MGKSWDTLQEYLDDEKPGVWQPIAKSLPPENGKYLVYCPSADHDNPLIATAWYHADEGWSLLPTQWLDAISHWMLLPEPPEQAQ